MISSNITALIPNPDKKGRIDVYADGELFMTLSEDAVLEAGLHVGSVVDADSLSGIERAVTLVKAKAKAYTYLSYGDMSEKMLYDKLSRAGFDQEVCTLCVENMKDAGYIDNVRYCRLLANRLANVKLYGPHKIYTELLQKGIPKELAKDWESFVTVDFEQNLNTLISGKFRCNTSDRKGQSRQIAALMRYGYSYDMIRSALPADGEEYYE